MKEIASTKLMKEILLQYYQSFFPTPPAKPPKVAWCTSVGPAEILMAMGFQVYFPENHGALLGATRESGQYIPVANAIGYSPDICSYLTSDVGAYLKKESPLQRAYKIPGVPRPDVLVYNTTQCREVQDWFLFYAREFNVPALGIFSPPKLQELTNDEIECVAKQFEKLIADLEKLTGNKCDWERLREIIELSRQTSVLWKKFLHMARTKPSPITFFDGCIQMAPAVMLRGTAVANRYYEALNQEVAGRVQAKVGALDNEQVRIYWEGMPIWGKLRFFGDLFERTNACVVASTYCNSWIFDTFSAAKPLPSLAEGYLQIFINRSESAKEAILLELIAEYQVDGIIFHDSKTCPHNSNARFGMPQRLYKNFGIPYLILHADLCDLRCFSEEQTLTAVESFVDQLKERK